MAHIEITSKENNLHTVVFKNMSLDNARAICDHMNKLNEDAAKKMGDVVKLIFRVIGS